jgi:hypothetical protein
MSKKVIDGRCKTCGEVLRFYKSETNCKICGASVPKDQTKMERPETPFEQCQTCGYYKPGAGPEVFLEAPAGESCSKKGAVLYAHNCKDWIGKE